jgi:hypothetical protein
MPRGKILEIELQCHAALEWDRTLFFPRDSIKIQVRGRCLFCSEAALDAEIFCRSEF